jgi:hypothetical protein
MSMWKVIFIVPLAAGSFFLGRASVPVASVELSDGAIARGIHLKNVGFTIRGDDVELTNNTVEGVLDRGVTFTRRY